MASRPAPETIDVDANHPSALVRAVQELLEHRTGWVNFQAELDGEAGAGLEDAPRGKAGIFGWFSSKGPAVPVCTWVPGAFDRRAGIEADEVGIQHAGGPRALVRLNDEGAPPPAGWRRLADHPKRGLVLASTHPTTADDVAPMVTWLILAARLLATDPLPATWTAVVHRR